MGRCYDSGVADDKPKSLRPQGKVTPQLKLDYVAKIKKDGPHLTFHAHAVGVCLQTINEHRKKDPEFDSAIEEARQHWVQNNIEQEVYRRAVTGWDEPIFYQGVASGKVRRHDGRLLLALAKRHESAYTERMEVKGEVKGEVGIDLSKLSAAGRAKLRALLEEETSGPDDEAAPDAG